MVRRRLIVLGFAVAAGAALAGFVPQAAFAKKTPPESFYFKLGKKKVKANLPGSVTGAFASLGSVLIVAGNILHGTATGFMTLTVEIPNPTTATFPLTVTGGALTYSYAKLGGAAIGWVGEGTISVTLTGFDAATHRLKGSFSGLLSPGDNTPGKPKNTTGKFNAEVMLN